MLSSLPTILGCIEGESWPTTSFKSFVDVTVDPPTQESITLLCPATHLFTLQQAAQKGILPRELVQRIVAYATQHLPEFTKEWQERIYAPLTASSFLPNADVVAQNWPCMRCSAKAQRGTKESALCLECEASWHNYDRGGAFAKLLNQTWGKPHNLFQEATFQRFLKNERPLDRAAAEQLLQDCRREAKQHKRTSRPKQ